MPFGVANISIIPVRDEPSEKSEMITQILFGEHFEIIKTRDKWCKIKLAFDKYEGWVDSKMSNPVTDKFIEKLESKPPFVTTEVINLITLLSKNSPLLIPAGCSIPFLNKRTGVFKVGLEDYQFMGAIPTKNTKNIRETIKDNALNFINAPYLWGGRNPFGIDCSGFAQIIYKIAGVAIPRDASKQVRKGIAVNFVNEALAGDLAFFDNDEGEIVHVGIMLDKSQIIHASGKVRVDLIDHQGIFNVDTKRYTHKLRVIKNIL